MTSTRKGNLPWQSSGSHAFKVSLGKQTLRIAEEPLGWISTSYTLELFRGDGKLVEIIRPRYSDGAIEDVDTWEVMRDLYELARGEALGATATFDELMDHLNGANTSA